MALKITEIYEFKKNQKLYLDDIYFIQGLGAFLWWEPVDEKGEEIRILTNIKIEIIITATRP